MVLASPDGCQLILVEEVHTSAIAADVEVLLKVSSLAEPDLGKITSSIITEADLAARLEDPVDVLYSLLPLQRRKCREDKDEERHVYRPFSQVGRQLIRRDIPHVGLHVVGVVTFMGAHDFDGLLGEVAGMDLESRVLVLCQDGEGCVARASSYLKERDGASILFGYLVQDGELLLQPLAVLEEVGSVVLIEQVPPLGRVRIESICLPRSALRLARR